MTGIPSNRWSRIGLFAILATALLVRLYRIDAPLLDGMSLKQVYNANKARGIAGPPFALFQNTFDWLDDDGKRSILTEEVPLYQGSVGICYALFGEHEWLGRLLSILATLVMIAAFHDLCRREFDDRFALLATLIFSFCPLLIFYGRAFQSDAAMVACMLLCPCFYHRYVADARQRWLIGAIVFGALACVFKVYALIVLLPLAELASRRDGWRACLKPAFVLMAASMVLPVGLWMGLSFLRSRNPAHVCTFFLHEEPHLLVSKTLYLRFVDRFMWKDCGPLTTLLIVAGLWAWWSGDTRTRRAYSWTAMGVVFYFLLGPKLATHDYYELMMLPAAALWAAFGWEALWGRLATASPALPRRLAGAAMLIALVVVQSPRGVKGGYETETGYKMVADRIHDLCAPSARCIVAGSSCGVEIIHYAHREGWVIEPPAVKDWRDWLRRYHDGGAEYVAVYFDHRVSPQDRASYQPLLGALDVVDHQAGAWGGGGRAVEYYILKIPKTGSASSR